MRTVFVPRTVCAVLVLVLALAVSSAVLAEQQEETDARAARGQFVPGVLSDRMKDNGVCNVNVRVAWSYESAAGVYASPLLFPHFRSDTVHSVLIGDYHSDVTLLSADGRPLPGCPMRLDTQAFLHTEPIVLDYNGDSHADWVFVSIDGSIYVYCSHARGGFERCADVMRVPALDMHPLWWADDDAAQPLRMLQEGPATSGSAGAHTPPPPQPQGATLSPTARDGPHFSMVWDQLTDEGRAAMDILWDPLRSDGSGSDGGGGADAPNWPRPQGNVQDGVRWLADYLAGGGGGAGVRVDAHVLGASVAADVNDDGHMDMLIPVSFYFDKEHYTQHSFAHFTMFSRNQQAVHAHNASARFDWNGYTACGLLAVDLRKGAVLWFKPLDFTRDSTQPRSIIYGSPLVLKDRVYLGTSTGRLYCLQLASAQLCDGWTADALPPAVAPAELDRSTGVELQAAPLAYDLLGTGVAQLVLADSRGRVSCIEVGVSASNDGSRAADQSLLGQYGLTGVARVAWTRATNGFVAVTPSLADIDGDGVVDVVVATLNGDVYALHGRTGATLPGFPIRTDGRILAPVLPLPASAQRAAAAPGQLRDGAWLVFASFDGHLYLFNGLTRCVQKVDLGGRVFGALLAYDMDMKATYEILLSTLEGHVLMLETDIPASRFGVPPRAQGGPVDSTLPEHTYAVSLEPTVAVTASTEVHWVRGADSAHSSGPTGHHPTAGGVLEVARADFGVTVVVRAPVDDSAGAGDGSSQSPLQLRFFLGPVGSVNSQGFLGEVDVPGAGVYHVPLPELPGKLAAVRTTPTSLSVQLTTSTGLQRSDTLPVRWSPHTPTLMKYLIVAPVVVVAAVVMLASLLRRQSSTAMGTSLKRDA